MKSLVVITACAVGIASFHGAEAADGRLIATGGATQLEGSAGGGLVPWAVLTSYAIDDEIGATAFATRVDVSDYTLDNYGVAATWHNRVELSLARQRFQLGTLGDLLGMHGAVVRQDILGAKLRLFGDVVYSDWPQVSLGVQRKHNLDFEVPLAVGALSDRGTDVYLAATKVFLAGAGGYNLLLNATLRSTSANQLGILGFGGDRGGRRLVGEASAAVLFTPRFAIGVEYRQKPDNLAFAREDSFRDVFAAWFPSKHLAVVGAWADLGSVATLDSQRGWYLSIQASL